VRRRLYLMRHAEVAHFDADGRPQRPAETSLTPEGEAQARAAQDALSEVSLDRVVTSGLPRTIETARIVSELEPEPWPELEELRSGSLEAIPDEEIEAAFLGAFEGVVPEEARFLGGESVGELFDRVLPALERLLADEWETLLAVLHGGVNRAILSYALTGGRTFLGPLEQAPACINIVDVGDDWIVRAVGWTPYDPAHVQTRTTTMEDLFAQYAPYRRGGRGRAPT
jgi:broad specificity phosphatase PhoE